jgi:hypothetical protein
MHVAREKTINDAFYGVFHFPTLEQNAMSQKAPASFSLHPPILAVP